MRKYTPNLGNIARELNMSMLSIVEFLNEKNFKIENNSSAKLTEEMYDIIIDEFRCGVKIGRRDDYEVHLLFEYFSLKIVIDKYNNEVSFYNNNEEKLDVLPLNFIEFLINIKHNAQNKYQYPFSSISIERLNNIFIISVFGYRGEVNLNGQITVPLKFDSINIIKDVHIRINKKGPGYNLGYKYDYEMIEFDHPSFYLKVIINRNNNTPRGVFFFNKEDMRLNILPETFVRFMINITQDTRIINQYPYISKSAGKIGNGIVLNISDSSGEVGLDGKVIIPFGFGTIDVVENGYRRFDKRFNKTNLLSIEFEQFSFRMIIDYEIGEVYFLNENHEQLNVVPENFIDFMLTKTVKSKGKSPEYPFNLIFVQKNDIGIIMKIGDISGLINSKGKIVIHFKRFSDIRAYGSEYFKIGHDKISDKNGKILIKNLSYIGDFSEGYAIVCGPLKKEEKCHYWGILDKDLNLNIIKDQDNYNRVENFSNGFAKGIISDYDDMGFNHCLIDLINVKGEIIINGVNSIIFERDNILTWNYRSIEKHVYALNGEYLLSLADKRYNDHVLELDEKCLIRAKKHINNKYKFGFVNKDYSIKIPFIFDDVGFMIDNIAIIKLNDKKGVIDFEGRLIIPTEYDVILRMNERLLLLNSGGKQTDSDNRNGKTLQGGKSGLASTKGELLTDLIYDKIYGVDKNGYIRVEKNELIGIIDLFGNEIISCSYNAIRTFEDNLFLVNIGGCIVDKNHKKIFIGGKWGFITSDNEIAIPIEFDYARPFSEGLAAVKITGKYGFIDKKGKIIIPPQFDAVADFHNEHSRVRVGNLYNDINTNGIIVRDWEDVGLLQKKSYEDDYPNEDWDDYSDMGCGEGYSCNECSNYGCPTHPCN